VCLHSRLGEYHLTESLQGLRFANGSWVRPRAGAASFMVAEIHGPPDRTSRGLLCTPRPAPSTYSWGTARRHTERTPAGGALSAVRYDRYLQRIPTRAFEPGSDFSPVTKVGQKRIGFSKAPRRFRDVRRRSKMAQNPDICEPTA